MTPDHPAMHQWSNGSSKAGLLKGTIEDDGQAATPPVDSMHYENMLAILVEQLASRLDGVQQHEHQRQQQDLGKDGCQIEDDDHNDAEDKGCSMELVRQFSPLNLGVLGLPNTFPRPSEDEPASRGWMDLTRQYTPIDLRRMPMP
eukprot:CAMPEP_0115213350 /NCGR_PEP_ID=MMETSP0270-20121206/23748_1 /TAXON_ID=71861 /ORGANISM="Scrippsiella trochoidea, Strain CCMP3099" /LENGTH=144 /DNA_ID=CAMNT_0002627095 /DNA_START=86 /DNA_END=520 /DNA_ORIENTATION=+